MLNQDTKQDHLQAHALVEALPYIQKFKDSIIVIKYGGNAMINDDLKEKVATDVVLLKQVGIHPVLCHGGGPEITKWLDKVGKKTEFINGLRVTDAETMEIAEMVLGRVAKGLVSLIDQKGGHAVSLSGKDGKLIRAKKMVTKDDLGFVGDVESVNTKLILTLINDGFIPVISSVGAGEGGESYNINADHMAGVLAGALGARKMVLMTDVDGVLDANKKLLSKLTEAQVNDLKDKGVIKGGMIPKVDCCIEALTAGAKAAHIINGTVEHSIILEILTDSGIGTMIVRE
jgi:acetylglutamate kinase